MLISTLLTTSAHCDRYTLSTIDSQLRFDGNFDGISESKRSTHLTVNNGYLLGLTGKYSFSDLSYGVHATALPISMFTPSFHRIGGDLGSLISVPGGGVGYKLQIQSSTNSVWYNVYSEKWAGLPSDRSGTIIDQWSGWPGGHTPNAVQFLCMGPDYVEAEPGRDRISLTFDLNIVANTTDMSARFPRVSNTCDCILTYVPQPASIAVSIPDNNKTYQCQVGRDCEIDNKIVLSGDTNVTARVRATHTDGIAAVGWGTTPPIAPDDTITTEIPVGSVEHNLRVRPLNTTAPGNTTINVNILAEIM